MHLYLMMHSLSHYQIMPTTKTNKRPSQDVTLKNVTITSSGGVAISILNQTQFLQPSERPEIHLRPT